MDNLPLIDEHQVTVSADASVVWRALATQFSSPSRTRTGTFLTVLGAQPRHATGTLLERGATIPGFAVTEVVPGEHVVLAGQHRFSQYALTLRLAEGPNGTVLSALTHARFPGVHGAIYRLLVIRSGAHRVVARTLLDTVRRRAER